MHLIFSVITMARMKMNRNPKATPIYNSSSESFFSAFGTNDGVVENSFLVEKVEVNSLGVMDELGNVVVSVIVFIVVLCVVVLNDCCFVGGFSVVVVSWVVVAVVVAFCAVVVGLVTGVTVVAGVASVVGTSVGVVLVGKQFVGLC